jgi:hypothetical protein
MVSRFRTAGATSPQHARTLEDLGISRGLILRRLRERAVVRQAGPDRYYLDEPSWEVVRRSRRRAIHVTWVIALVIVLAVLFARRAFAVTSPVAASPEAEAVSLTPQRNQRIHARSPSSRDEAGGKRDREEDRGAKRHADGIRRFDAEQVRPHGA